MTFFYNLNKKLDEIRATPSTTHGQLNERDMSRAAKGYEKYGKEGMEALAKAGREGKALDPVRNKYDKYDESVEEGIVDTVKKVGSVAKKLGGRAMDTLGHGSDADMIRDLQKKMGIPQTGMKPGAEPNPKVVKEKMSPGKAKSFAALAEPKDKITFADKIAGAKKEVDEMLGDVAAEAMKSALSGGKQVVASEDDDNNPFTSWKKPRADKPKVGSVERGHKHDIEHTATGRKVTRRVDPAGISVGADDDAPASGEKRGRGRPAGKGAGKSIGAKGPSGKSKLMTKEAVSEDDIEVIERLMDEAFAEGNKALGNALQTALERIQGDQDEDQYDDDEQVNEKAVSKKQQKFMGMVHAAQKGEKPASKKVANVAKDMGKKDAEDFAATKHKGLPEKAKESSDTRDTRAEKAGKKVTKDIEYDEKTKDGDHGKKRGPQDAKAEKAGKKVAKDIEHDEKVDETTDSKKSSGIKFGGGIYDSMNRELENMIAESMARLDESMSINMSMNNDEHGGPSKSLTVTATDDDAMQLSQLLKSAGLGGGDDQGYGGTGYQSACGCSEPGCGCDQQEMGEAYGDTEPTENAPNYPTNTETSADPFQYSGGLNKPKATGQTTTPVIASQTDRQHSYAEAEEDALHRMMEMAGVKKKEVDEEKTDEGNKFTGNLAKARAAGKKEADLDGDGDMEKVQESIFDLTNQWRAYKG
jgi:hypothetical protein